MKETTIEKLAYTIKQTKEKPIVFLGAGASVTGNIPLARDVEKFILEEYKDNPYIQETDDKSYSGLMECLSADQRNTLLKDYIDKAKINITHIYLAQLMEKGFIDYVLTVNFDNLMLRALSLYNIYPPTYDMAILKDLTTSTFHKKSVVYLHGQHHGLWLLNTEEEMNKVKDVIPPILNSIKDRPWIFIGYSANDPIFEHVKNLGRFDKGLFWVGYKDNNAPNNVQNDLLDKANTNSFFIKGHDSDSFMIKLNHELGQQQPNILEKPFSFLHNSIENIVDINDSEEYKDIKQRLEIIKKQVSQSIQEYEEGKIVNKTQEELNLDLLRKKIIDTRLNEDFSDEHIEDLNKEIIGIKDTTIDILMSHLYFTLGNKLYNKKDFDKATIKYEQASILNPKDDSIFNNWGTTLLNLAKLNEDKKLFNESFNKYEQASILNPKDDSIFYNWGTALSDLAKLNEDEKLFNESFNKYEQASILNPKDDSIFNNWGTTLLNLAKLNEDKKLFNESFNKYEQASILNPKDDSIFYNWGTALSDLAKLNEDEKLFNESFNKYEQASILNPKDDSIFNNWGNALLDLARLNEDEELFNESFNKYEQASILNPKDDSIFNNWGTALSDLAKLNKDEKLFNLSFDKYEQASILNHKDDSIFYNWGTTLSTFAKINEDEKTFTLAFDKLNKAVELGGASYNLACLYSLKNKKEEALDILNKSLIEKEITKDLVLKDEDWSHLLYDEDFLKVINKYD